MDLALIVLIQVLYAVASLVIVSAGTGHGKVDDLIRRAAQPLNRSAAGAWRNPCAKVRSPSTALGLVDASVRNR